MGNEEVFHTVKEERNIVHTIKRRKANRIGHILRRNCFLKHIVLKESYKEGYECQEDEEEDVSS